MWNFTYMTYAIDVIEPAKVTGDSCTRVSSTLNKEKNSRTNRAARLKF